MSSVGDLSGVRWRVLAFDALSVAELYRVLRLRAEVFVVEQNCAFQDLDGLDESAMHLLGEIADDKNQVRLMAYARLSTAGAPFDEASVGRVVTSPSARGTGLGHRLMAEAVVQLHWLWGEQPIRIGAQAHLQGYYQQCGFKPQGGIYMEDGIEHIEMVRP